MDSSNDFNLKFIEAYQREPCIWDPAHFHHKNKKKVSDAWLRISNDLVEGVDDLKKRKESLMATFRGHLRKKKASIKSGAGEEDVYKPIWYAYDLMESFLGRIYDCNPTISTQETTDPTISLDEDSQQGGARCPSTNGDNEPSKSQQTPSNSQQTIRRRKQPPELQEAGNQMNNALNMLSHVITQQKPLQEEDDCDLFAKMLAKKLRKLPEHERESLMYQMHGMLVNRNQNLPRYSTPPTPIYHQAVSPHSSSSGTVDYQHGGYAVQSEGNDNIIDQAMIMTFLPPK